MKALIMGLGLNGGGLASAQYLAKHGADITITDLRDEEQLTPTLEQLGDTSRMRLVLGRHEMADFENADIVVKNPGVRPDSPYLKVAKRVETDISLFLQSSPARLIAVTGSKGKSGTASSLHWALKKARERGILRGNAFLGGNITISPLTFLDDLTAEDDVVLELSSWQLGDLRGRMKSVKTGLGFDTSAAQLRRAEQQPLLKPRVAVITAILPDHLDRYGTMGAYIADKRVIYQAQTALDATVVANDRWGLSFLKETHGHALVYADHPLPLGVEGGWISEDGPGFACIPANSSVVEIVPEKPLVPGLHQKKNLLAAGLGLLDLGLSAPFIAESLGSFPGIEHRLEFFCEKDGVKFYNDTTATIPEAAAAALEAFPQPVVLVTGGTDKQLNFGPLVKAIAKAPPQVSHPAPHVRAVILLA